MHDLDFLNARLFTLGGSAITLWDIVFVVVAVMALLWFAAHAQRWLDRRLSTHTRLDPSMRKVVDNLVRISILVIGVLVIVQAVGINLTTFNVVAGAVGVGIGVGLQNVVSNFIGGLIVLFERPVNIGDRIAVSGVEGRVRAIGARATRIQCADGTVVIVPNQSIIGSNVTTWPQPSSAWQLVFPLSVKLGTDIDALRQTLLATAAADADVLREPTPFVNLVSTAGALAFELRLYTAHDVVGLPDLQSRLRQALLAKLTAAGIEVQG